MATNDAIALAIAAGLKAVKSKRVSKSNDPAINIATLAYWDGIQNLASKIVDVFDGKEDSEAALDYIIGYLDELIDVMREVLEDEMGEQDG